MEAQTEEGQAVSTMLQNAGTSVAPEPLHMLRAGTPHLPCPAAFSWNVVPTPPLTSIKSPLSETVRLVGPDGGDCSGSRGGQAAWRAISVSQLAPGDQVLILQQEGARHTGIAIQERINEL